MRSGFAVLSVLVVLTIPPSLPGGPRHALAQGKYSCYKSTAFDPAGNYVTVGGMGSAGTCVPKCSDTVPEWCVSLLYDWTQDCTTAGNEGCPYCWFLDIAKWDYAAQDYTLIFSQQMTSQQTAVCGTAPRVQGAFKKCLSHAPWRVTYEVYNTCSGGYLERMEQLDFNVP